MSARTDIPGLLTELLAAAPAGFAAGLHLRYTSPTYMFQTYPRAWVEEYTREGLLMRDPTVAWGLSHTGSIAWSELPDGDPDGVMARARAHGLAHGLTLSLDRGESRSIGSFARSDRAFLPVEIDTIREALESLHDVTLSAAPLSPATRAALRRLSVAFSQI